MTSAGCNWRQSSLLRSSKPCRLPRVRACRLRRQLLAIERGGAGSRRVALLVAHSCLARSWLAHGLLMACSWLAHGLRMACPLTGCEWWTVSYNAPWAPVGLLLRRLSGAFVMPLDADSVVFPLG
jgi:hypothetical protein